MLLVAMGNFRCKKVCAFVTRRSSVVGFFVCKLKKMANGPKDSRGEGKDGEASDSEEEGVPVEDAEQEEIDAAEKAASKAAAAKAARNAGSKRSAPALEGLPPLLVTLKTC